MIGAEKGILAAACLAFAVAALVFLYFDRMWPSFFSMTGMLVCRYAMGRAK